MGKKLIEVALPLEEINKASAREKSIRHGHPSTLHLWWARRPLAACRAVLFGSLVDDPSALPDRFPSEEAQRTERERLFQILIRFVQWESSTNRAVIAEARAEVAKSIARSQGDPEPVGEAAIDEHLATKAPPILDPFCGGGSIPLEAQRLGLRAYGSDLNPVAVLITKALIEIPPKFRGRSPVNPDTRRELGRDTWTGEGAVGLAEDVRHYGQWMREEAEKRIGHLYPKATLPDGSKATVIAWLWARTVTCPNPACRAQMPLVRSFALSTKAGKKAWVEPVVDRSSTPPKIRFEVKTGKGEPPAPPKVSRGAKFRCLCCDQIAPDKHIKSEGSSGRMGQTLMAIVAEGPRGRTYLPPDAGHVAVANGAEPSGGPEQELPYEPRAIWCTLYGLKRFRDLFTPRQLVALTTFSDLVGEARERVLRDAIAAGLPDDGISLDAGGTAAPAYADAVATYLALAVDRIADYGSSICSWHSGRDTIRNTYARQALPMTWDFAETNVLSASTGNFEGAVDWISKSVSLTPVITGGRAVQIDATKELCKLNPRVITTDPPYYDNIGYADLSDFFYVWLRRSLRPLYPGLFSTLTTPKDAELIASPYRHGGSTERAKAFFERGLAQAFGFMRDDHAAHFPFSLFYAYKQAESEAGADGDDRISSTGWETMLGGLLNAGLSVNGTWPMRSEMSNRPIASGTNALASSIVLVCWPRPDDAPRTTRKEFQRELRRELPPALARLQESDIPPVDLQQAVLGPGMAVFSRYAEVLEADGSPMRVKSALQMINHLLHELLAEQVGQMDEETSFCSVWYEQYGFEEKSFGEAEVLSKAKNTSVDGLREAGVLVAGRGKVRLRKRAELDDHWDPATDPRLTGWECAQHLVQALSASGNGSGKAGGITKAAELVQAMGSERAQAAHDLAYRLFTIADRKKWQEEALAYNMLISAWPDIQDAVAALPARAAQTTMGFGGEARP